VDASRIFSNGPAKDFVIKPFTRLIAQASRIHIAAPYVTKTDELLQAAKLGKPVDLLVGLNAGTSPASLAAIYKQPGISIRYFTHRFHAKIYLFDGAALLGSSNLTESGLAINREATILLEEPNDSATILELRRLFAELWKDALVLTPEKLKRFQEAHERFKHSDPDALIGGFVGKAEPSNINISSQKRTAERIFLEGLRSQVARYGNSFNEVKTLLDENQLWRAELIDASKANQTNRFLSWVRRTYALGEAWESAPVRSQDGRRTEILRLGQEWIEPAKDTVHKSYVIFIQHVESVFGTTDAVESASKEDITRGLMSVHAFLEQLRFVKGGEPNLPIAFWAQNNEDVDRVKMTLKHLVHGAGDFVERLHDVLYDQAMKLKLFGIACALELCGTIKPEECPPINGRISKALRYLGFDIQAL
jgi:hypothetical protein